MANQEHLDILKQGVEIWNQWRKEHPDIQPDLKEVDLTGANLAGANLYQAEMQGVILKSADLTGVHLIISPRNWTGK